MAQMVKSLACNVGDLGSIPGPGTSPGGGNDNPLQHSCLENSMDRGAWRASLWGHKELNMTEWLTFSPSLMAPWAVAHQAPLSMGFPRQEHWSGLLFPPPGDLPDPGIEPTSLLFPALAARFLTTSTTWEALIVNSFKVSNLKFLLKKN